MSTLPTSESIAVDWLRDGRRVVSATLVETIGSAPLDPGAQMLIDDQLNIEGSVTGGCVEGALVEEAQQILAGAAPKVVTYGISDEQATGRRPDVRRHRAGLRAREPRRALDALDAVAEARAAGEPVALATLLEGEGAGAKMAILADRAVGGLGVTELLDHSVQRDARGQLDEGLSRIRRYGADGAVMGVELAVYIQAFSTRPRMVIFGAIDFSAEMAKLASEVGYAVTICDARRPFVESPRFSASAEVVVDWPDRYLEGQGLGRATSCSSSPTTRSSTSRR